MSRRRPEFKSRSRNEINGKRERARVSERESKRESKRGSERERARERERERERKRKQEIERVRLGVKGQSHNHSCAFYKCNVTFT